MAKFDQRTVKKNNMWNATDVHFFDCDELPPIFDVDDRIHFFPEKRDEKSNKIQVEDDFEITANNEETAIWEEEIDVSQIDESNEFCFELLPYIPSWFDVAFQNIEPSPVSQLTYILKEEINISHEYVANNINTAIFLTMKSLQKISLYK